MKQVDLDRQTILITGAAGFIGSSLVKRLLEYTTSYYRSDRYAYYVTLKKT